MENNEQWVWPVGGRLDTLYMYMCNPVFIIALVILVPSQVNFGSLDIDCILHVQCHVLSLQ